MYFRYRSDRMMFMRLTIGCGLIAIVFFSDAFAKETSSYEFGETCSVFLKELDENREVYVVYKGKYVKAFCNDFSFQGRGDEIMDEYKVCVTPQHFSDPDCAIQLEYTSSVIGETLHNVTCSKNYNTKFCGSEEDYLYINFKTRDDKSTSGASFKLLVTAEKVFDYGTFVGAIIGGVFGGIILITAITGIVFWCVCRRKPTQGQVLGTAQSNSAQTVNQPLAPYATYSTPQTTNSTTLYPTGNYSTQYSTAEYSTQPFQYSQTAGLQQK